MTTQAAPRFDASRLTIERNHGYEPEQTPCGWIATKLVLLPGYTVYARVGSPEYMTPVAWFDKRASHERNRDDAETYVRAMQKQQEKTQ